MPAVADHHTRALPLGPMHATAMWRAVCTCPWRSRITYTTKAAAAAVGRGHEIAERVMDAATCQHRETT